MARVAVLASSTEGNFGPSGLGMAGALEHRRGNAAHDRAHWSAMTRSFPSRSPLWFPRARLTTPEGDAHNPVNFSSAACGDATTRRRPRRL